jgi:Protein of unknown function (DUF2541)
MPLKTFVLTCLAMLFAVLTPASAQRGAVADDWEFLGEQTVAFSTDNDSIVINQGEEWYRNRAFRALRFTVERNDVELKSIRLIYINGHQEELNIGKTVRRGGQLAVDLRGERSFLKQIDMRYRSNFGISLGGGGIRIDQAVVKVYGERVKRAPAPAPVIDTPAVERNGWSVIDTRRFDSGENQIVFNGHRGDGRFSEIRLRAASERIRIRDVQVRFRNGEIQTVPIDSRLEAGDETRAIDLAGEKRVIDTVTVNLDPRRRSGQAELQLLGLRRASAGGAGGDVYAGRGWTLLGEQTVGFRAERDVIEVGQTEEWHRSRQFRSLHLIAQRNDIYMKALRVTYINGHVEEFVIDRTIPAGTDSEVDLRGERSYIRRIEMVYRARPSFRGQAVMKVYGDPGRRG